MILCSVRIIIVFISLLAELSNPPVVFDQANQNISCGFSPGKPFFIAVDLLCLFMLCFFFQAMFLWSWVILQYHKPTLSLATAHCCCSYQLNWTQFSTFTETLQPPSLWRGVLAGLNVPLTMWVVNFKSIVYCQYHVFSLQMFAIALICASMVYVSLLSIIIYSIWTHTNRNKKLSRKIRITNGKCFAW